MPSTTYFVQDCPTCGRRLQIRVEYLGRKMVCDHCHGRFVARDSSSVPRGALESDVLRRAEACSNRSNRSTCVIATCLRPREAYAAGGVASDRRRSRDTSFRAVRIRITTPGTASPTRAMLIAMR